MRKKSNEFTLNLFVQRHAVIVLLRTFFCFHWQIGCSRFYVFFVLIFFFRSLSLSLPTFVVAFAVSTFARQRFRINRRRNRCQAPEDIMRRSSVTTYFQTRKETRPFSWNQQMSPKCVVIGNGTDH